MDKETREQKEYITSLHQDIDESIKRAKRDKSDNYLEINKLGSKIKHIEITSRKTEESVLKTASLYVGILEKINQHLYLLQQKDRHEQDKLEEEDTKPFVATEGEFNKSKHKSIYRDTITNSDDVHGLDNQLAKLEEMMMDNNRLYEDQLKNEFDHYEEQKQLISSMRQKSRLTSPDSMPRLRSAKRRAQVSPNQQKARQSSMIPQKLIDDPKISKLPSFGPFTKKRSYYNPKGKVPQPLNFNDRKMAP